MSGTAKRNRLLPWMIELVLLLAVLAHALWHVLSGGCGATQPAVLIIAPLLMPAAYLKLMYLTLTSQEQDRRMRPAEMAERARGAGIVRAKPRSCSPHPARLEGRA